VYLLLGEFVRRNVMRYKMFQDKGREYYNIIYSLINLALLVGVWLPYIQSGLESVGIYVSKFAITVFGLTSMFVVVNVGLVFVGWLTYQKELTQSELLFKFLQEPLTPFLLMLYMRETSFYDELSKKEGVEKEWKGVKNKIPLVMTIGKKTIVDLDKSSYKDVKRLISESRRITVRSEIIKE
jgi:hypothetical protein